MTTLIDKVCEMEGDNQVKDMAEYRRLLQENDSKEAKKLQTIMGRLGIGPERLADDLATLRKAAAYETEASGDNEQLRADLTAAAGAEVAFRNETETILQRRDTEQRRLSAAVSLLGSRLQQAKLARRKLRELQQAHRQLFRLAEPKPAPEPGPVYTGWSYPPVAETPEQVANHRPIQRLEPVTIGGMTITGLTREEAESKYGQQAEAAAVADAE